MAAQSGGPGSRAHDAGRASGARTLVSLCLLATFVGLKVVHAEEPFGRRRADATYFYQVAEHVAAGDGLRTSVSLYHQGLRDMPSRTNVYPLWPLALGSAGSVVGTETAAWVLPRALYVLDLVLLYVLANRLAGRRRTLVSVGGRPVVDVGHAAAALFATNAPFFHATSQCLTEGLAFALLFGALLAVPPSTHPRPLARGVLAGAMAGLAALARSQFALLPVALAMALFACARGRRSWRVAAGGLVLAALAVVAPWVAWLVALPGEFHARMLLDFASYRETPGLPRFEGFVDPATFGAFLDDVAAGLRVAFDPTDRLSYFESFGAAVWILPLAVVSLLTIGHRSPRAAPEPLALATLGAGLACLLPTHAMHATFPIPWWFAKRHGLPLVLWIIVGLAWAARRGSWSRAIAGLLVVWAVFGASSERLLRERGPGGMQPSDRELVAWLDAHPVPPTCAALACRELALWSDATFHWLRLDRASVADVRTLIAELELDYVLVHPGLRATPTARALLDELPLAREFGPPPALAVLAARPLGVEKVLGGPKLAEDR